MAITGASATQTFRITAPAITKIATAPILPPPEVLTAVSQGRARLLEDAKLDAKIVSHEKANGGFVPVSKSLCEVAGMGTQIIKITGSDCVALHAHNTNGPFRKGMVEQFRFWQFHKRNDLANAYIAPMAKMISSVTGMSIAEATTIVSESRATSTFSVRPQRTSGESFPGAGIPMTPLPQVMTEEDASLFPFTEEEEELILQIDGQAASAASACGFLREVDPAGDCKISTTGWLVIGGGALALAGGAFLIMRRNR